MKTGIPRARRVPCPQCGWPLRPEARRCRYCGAQLAPPLPPFRLADEPARDDSTTEVPLVREVGTPEDDRTVILPNPPRLRVAFVTHMGRTHQVNQDAGGVWLGQRLDGAAGLVAVADGVSAGRTSEEASRLSIDLVAQRVVPLLESTASLEDLLSALEGAAREANLAIAQRPYSSLRYADATTLAALVYAGTQGAGLWCGDSRVYLVGQETRRLTIDHSWAADAVRQGLMNPDEASRDYRAHMITRWLGPPERENPGLETFAFTLQPGEIALCCTDGLSLYFAPPHGQEAEIAAILRQHGDDLQGGIDHLAQIALERGGRDDITIAALQLI